MDNSKIVKTDTVGAYGTADKLTSKELLQTQCQAFKNSLQYPRSQYLLSCHLLRPQPSNLNMGTFGRKWFHVELPAARVLKRRFLFIFTQELYLSLCETPAPVFQKMIVVDASSRPCIDLTS